MLLPLLFYYQETTRPIVIQRISVHTVLIVCDMVSVRSERNTDTASIENANTRAASKAQ